jgi:5-methylcytosine-specific restriction protein A
MPYAPKSLCTESGCGELVAAGKCETHRLQAQREADHRRPKGYAKAYDATWRAASRKYLKTHPSCECTECDALPIWARPTATVVDHIDGRGPSGPHGYDPSNWQAMCRSHHSRKTALYDGGFGRPRKAQADERQQRTDEGSSHL